LPTVSPSAHARIRHRLLPSVVRFHQTPTSRASVANRLAICFKTFLRTRVVQSRFGDWQELRLLYIPGMIREGGSRMKIAVCCPVWCFVSLVLTTDTRAMICDPRSGEVRRQGLPDSRSALASDWNIPGPSKGKLDPFAKVINPSRAERAASRSFCGASRPKVYSGRRFESDEIATPKNPSK